MFINQLEDKAWFKVTLKQKLYVTLNDLYNTANFLQSVQDLFPLHLISNLPWC